MNVSQRQPEIDMSVLNDEQLESILALSDFLTRYHSQFATFPPDANGETDDDDDTTDGGLSSNIYDWIFKK